MNPNQADALVFFGATGDLAYKKIFPSLMAMLKRGHLDVPVIGVAKAGWASSSSARARDSLEKHGPVDEAAFAKFCGPAATSTATTPTMRRSPRCAASSTARRARRTTRDPAGAVRTVIEKGAVRLHARGRVIVEKPFGTDLASAQRLNKVLHAGFDERRSSASTTTSASGRSTTCFFALRQRAARAVLEPQAHRERADHDGRVVRHPGPRRVLRPDRHRARRDPEPPVPGAREPGDGAAGAPTRVDPRREGQGAEGDPPIAATDLVRGQFDGYLDEPGVAKGSKTETFARCGCA